MLLTQLWHSLPLSLHYDRCFCYCAACTAIAALVIAAIATRVITAKVLTSTQFRVISDVVICHSCYSPHCYRVSITACFIVVCTLSESLA